VSWLKTKGPNLLDVADRWPTEWWLVYTNLDEHDDRGPGSRLLARVLHPGFQHVQAIQRDGRVWVAVYPHMEFVDVKLIRSDETPWQLYPGCTIQHVIAMRDHGRMYSKFHVGPWSCVEVIKSLLGIRSWWVRTPWQLYQHVKRGYAHG